MVFVAVILSQSMSSRVYAAELKTRSVMLGDGFAGVTTNHLFGFRSLGPSTVQSMMFEYCSNSPLIEVTCSPPSGLDVTGFTIDNQFGITGYTSSGATTTNSIIINRVSSVEPATISSYDLGGIVNPSISNQTVFVRMTVYDGVDATGGLVDYGSVAFVVEERVNLQAYVPPYMTFCVGVSVALDCSSATGALVGFGELSSVTPVSATTQFAVATNDPDGYNTYLNGQTMTAGNKLIPALSTQSASTPGVSQFGLNLRLNTVPLVGADPEAGLVAAGSPDAAYNSPNLFRFVDGDRVAGSSITTGFDRYTVSYLVNVDADQSAGIYATTLTYTSIAAF